MKIRSNYDFYSVEECEQDAKEMVNLLKMERTCSTMKERLSRLNFEVYDTDCGYIAGSKVEHEGLEYVELMRPNLPSWLLLWQTISTLTPKFTTTALCPCAIVLAKLLTALVRTAKPQP